MVRNGPSGEEASALTGAYRGDAGGRSVEEGAPSSDDGEARSSGFLLFRDHPREAWTVMALTAGGTLAFYAYTTYMQKFLVVSAGMSPETVSIIMTTALVCFMACQPLF